MKVEISKKDSDYMYNFIQRIIDDVGCRMPCSKQEAMGAEIIRAEMEEICDEVAIEPFTCSPRAALGFIRIAILLILLSYGAFFLVQFNDTYAWNFTFAIISVVLGLLTFLLVWKEFFNYEEFVDPLFKKKGSQNVVGKIKPKGEIKHIIIFSGHHDSALQFNLLRYLKVGYPIIIFLGFGIMFIWIVYSILFLYLTLLGLPSFMSLANYEWFFEAAIRQLIIGSPALVGLSIFTTPGSSKGNLVPGAIDNLSAVAVVLGVGRYLKENKEVIPENTEIRLISFGCEEAFLRGACRYVTAHLDELKKYDANIVNMDGISSTTRLFIAEFEPSTRTKHSPEVVKKLEEASKLVGVEAKILGSKWYQKLLGVISGGTDAAAFSKAEIKASSLISMSLKTFFKAYHQPGDTLDKIEKGSLENALKVCLGYIKNESKTIEK
jgi:hypothetical protein